MRRYLTSLLCTALVVLASGCAHSLRFSVVDAETRRPLQEVEVEWRKTTPGFLKDIHFDTIRLAQPRNAHFVEVNAIDRKGSHNFIFTKLGYQPARFVFAHGEGWCLSPDATNSVESNFSPVTYPVVIPMHPAKSQNKTQ